MGTVLEQEGYQSVDDDGFCVFWTGRVGAASAARSLEARRRKDWSTRFPRSCSDDNLEVRSYMAGRLPAPHSQTKDHAELAD